MDVEKLKKCGKIETFPKGTFICHEGEEGQTAYLILLGRADVFLDSFSNKPKKVAELRAGNIFGEMSLLENKPRNASVQAAWETTTLVLDKNNFLQVIQTDIESGFALLKNLSDRLEKTLSDNGLALAGLASDIRRDPMYSQIRNLNQLQYCKIIDSNPENALKLMKFLSYKISVVNSRIVRK